MSFVDSLTSRESIYIIPKGAQNKEEIIQIKPTKGSTRLEVFFPPEQYQVISDQTLKERRLNIQEYIKQTEGWRR